MKKVSVSNILKILYGVLFVVVVPFLLILWASATEESVRLPPVNDLPAGIALSTVGLALLLAGMHGLIVHGNGLPMNAFPPAYYVRHGIYRLLPHPIYTGFSFLCFGTAMILGSASGFWLVAPIATLGCTALVMGFERQDLHNRFGRVIAGQKCLVALPSASDGTPYVMERVSVYLLVFIPWVILYELFVVIGVQPGAFPTYLPFEHGMPVIEWAELFYGATYVFVGLVPLVVRQSGTLRAFAIAGIVATFAMVLFFAAIPAIARPRGFTTDTLFGNLLQFEREHDTQAAAFPSYHIVWTMIAVRAFVRSFPRARLLWRLIALLITVSCITTGMHSVVDVVCGIIAGAVFVRYAAVWEWMRSAAEHTANAWREWRVGTLRIINHGIFSGIGAATGLWIVGVLLGPEALWFALIVAASSLIIAGLWAQLIEGSPSLLRPFGYYGGVIGVAVGAVIALLPGGEFWPLLGAFSVAGPVIQAFGRVRCLMQGCCHGRKTTAAIGICHTHPRSRVVRLAELGGVPLHPTALYSILWNLVTGVLLARLWQVRAEPALITGLYLMLNGLGRFVEEAYRGEPQTPILGKLRLYQMMAVVSIVSGAFVSTVRTGWTAPAPEFSIVILPVALGFGVVTWFAQGVDFPESDKRFARLV